MAQLDTSTVERAVPEQRTPSYDEQGLLRAAALGDVDAWESLVAAHAPALWRAALGAGRTAHEAAALCELAWCRAAEGLSADRRRGWLHGELLRALDDDRSALVADVG